MCGLEVYFTCSSWEKAQRQYLQKDHPPKTFFCTIRFEHNASWWTWQYMIYFISTCAVFSKLRKTLHGKSRNLKDRKINTAVAIVSNLAVGSCFCHNLTLLGDTASFSQRTLNIKRFKWEERFSRFETSAIHLSCTLY